MGAFRPRLPQKNTLSFTRCYSSRSSDTSAPRLTHLDFSGRASMVDVSDKAIAKRSATAQGRIFIPPIAYDLVTSTHSHSLSDDAPPSPLDQAKEKVRRKGDTLTVAQIAGIMASKKTSDLIPLCHSLSLSKVAVTLAPQLPGSKYPRHSILCTAIVTCEGKTGVEMEALTAVSVGLLTVWDMLKAVAGKDMEIGNILVSKKTGGKSGDFYRV